MHLVDHARQHIERTYRRPLGERLLRWTLANVLPYTSRFRLALRLASIARPFRGVLPARLRGLVDAAEEGLASKRSAVSREAAHGRLEGMKAEPLPPSGARAVPGGGARVEMQLAGARGVRRVALLPGCVQPALRPEINEAAVRVLNRFGVEVVVAPGTGCCGALVHHLGREHQANAQAKADIEAWTRELDTGGLDAIIVTASGCGTMLKDYGFMFRNDPEYAVKAKRVSELARDISEVISQVLIDEARGKTEALNRRAAESGESGKLRVAYHSACSLQHGQKLHGLAPELLRKAGFAVLDIPESHICCGSAGTYSMLQPEMSGQLRDRKVGNIESVRPDVIATGNIGCMTQIGQGTQIPVVHTIELIDWATGGPKPARLQTN